MAFGAGGLPTLVTGPSSSFPLSDVDYRYAGFEVLRAEVLKITIFWDITPCSPLKVTCIFRVEE
jgi:hypothetical protein